MDRLPHRAVRGGVAKMVVRAHDHAARAAFGDHRAGVVERQRQRLLAENMLARLGCGKDLGAVQLVGRRDVDRIDVLRFDQFLEARCRARDSDAPARISRRDPRSCS